MWKLLWDLNVFFDACYRGIIAIDDFDCNSSKELKRVVCSKLKHLVTLSNFFENEIIAQEDFSKGVVKCLLGVSNRKFTIGFVDAKYCVRPMTLLADNHLDENKPIINAKIIIDWFLSIFAPRNPEKLDLEERKKNRLSFFLYVSINIE